MRKHPSFLRPILLGTTAVTAAFAAATPRASAQAFAFGDLLISSSTYAGDASTVTVGQPLPNSNGATATNNGTYFGVFNNDTPDANFGITSPITITQITPSGASTGVVINVPASYLTTSFSSKSELALNLSADGTAVTFMGYNAGINQLDISNANTPGNPASGNTDTAPATYRGIGQLNADGTLTAAPTLVATYSGDNSRAAILAGGHYYTVGSTGGTDTSNTGAQIVTPGGAAGSNSTSLGSYSFDSKPAKDNNFRGETVFNNTLFVTKGSGSKGVDSVYQVGAAGTLPTGTGNSVTILPGFNTAAVPGSGGVHPFGLFFANSTTLYVADEGTGLNADFANSNNNAAGLQKWVLNTGNGQWSLQYTMRLGLNIGVNYTVNGTSGGVAGSFTTATDGLRNLTGKVNLDGTVTLFALTSTASTQDGTNNSADEGTDPNKLVSITDTLAFSTASQASNESFATLESAAYGQVLRGVSFTPQAAPEPSTWAMLAGGFSVGLIGWARRTRRHGLAAIPTSLASRE